MDMHPLQGQDRERSDRILSAAELCFVRAGFHRATMADVALEAGMSAGNLYRYFKSKDEIVAGLAARDMAELGDDFSRLACATDFLAAFEELGTLHFVEAPRHKAALQLEIWAEASRNPRIAEMCAQCERRVEAGLTAVFEAARAQGAVASGVPIGRAVRLMMLLADGLFRRRALDPAFDARAELDLVFTVVRAVLTGLAPLPPVHIALHEAAE